MSVKNSRVLTAGIFDEPQLFAQFGFQFYRYLGSYGT